jgi:hypothetical protein
MRRYLKVQRKHRHVLPVDGDIAGAPFFEFDGPAAELFTKDAYWIALTVNTTAILLVGSSTHVYGAAPVGETATISPSTDPDGVAKAFAEGQEEGEESWVYSYIWGVVMSNALKTTPTGDLRPLRGVAENRGWRYAESEQLAGFSGDTSKLLLGAPLYVEGA